MTKKEKGDSKDWHIDFIPVTKDESDKISEQMKDGIPPNMFVIRGDRIVCGGDEDLRHEG